MQKPSIHTANILIIITWCIINIIFLICYIFLPISFLVYLIISSAILNICIISLWFFINKSFIKDNLNLIDFFKNIVEDKGVPEMPKNVLFIENKKIESLFKKAYIKWNLLKKDFLELKNIFNKFIPFDIYSKISFKWYEKVTLWSCVSKKVTIMFLDIMWFTKISEKISPERTLLLLNIYFDWIWDIVYSKWWYIDKFLWDWIMVLFEDDNSDSALLCSIEIQEFMKKFQVSTIWKQIDVWIWINSWEVIMWTIWTKKRMDATVIWDNVNIASRLESLTRSYEKPIIISESTLDIINEKDRFIIESLWKAVLNWKEKPIEIFSLDTKLNLEL